MSAQSREERYTYSVSECQKAIYSQTEACLEVSSDCAAFYFIIVYCNVTPLCAIQCQRLLYEMAGKIVE